MIKFRNDGPERVPHEGLYFFGSVKKVFRGDGWAVCLSLPNQRMEEAIAISR
jgi:hypothetical protein